MEKQADLYKTESAQKDMQVGDLQKKMMQQEGRLKNSMKMFVNMRDDRDYYSHSSYQLQSEIKESEKKNESKHALLFPVFDFLVNFLPGILDS